MKYKHLFFDLDHTIWDFEANSRTTLVELYEEMKLEERGVVLNLNQMNQEQNIEELDIARIGKMAKQKESQIGFRILCQKAIFKL